MKLPYSWLKEFVETKKTAEEIADKLTMAGMEVEEVIGSFQFDNVFVGEVMEVEKHPNADKLRIAKVNIGKEELLQIVCGASNLEKGQMVPVAVVGAKLDDFEIKKATLRGIDSFGMICSERELGISENHEGIMVLDGDLYPGTNLRDYLSGDKVIDVNIPANRPDCMGILGLSREVAVCTNETLKYKEPILKENNSQKTEDLVQITVEDFSLCSRYMTRVVRNVSISPSPDWLKERLTACGIRPINNLIDISNYVMLALGQPLHFFDLDKIRKNNGKTEVIVRKSKKNEMITTIDGEERKLAEGTLLIADTDKPIAIAGIMGGNNSEIDENTKNILIEAAVFDKASIRRTSRMIGLRTEAVARFEKGIPFDLPNIAIDHAAHLLFELANGEICSGKIDVFESKKELNTIEVIPDKVNKFLGLTLSENIIENILSDLGFGIEKNQQGYTVTSPWWREDILVSADLYEEIARVYGYDKIPSSLPSTGDTVPKQNGMYQFQKEIRGLLSSIGMTEILTYSFVSSKELSLIGEDISKAPKIANPLVSTQELMRTSLLSGMFLALKENQFNKEVIQLFEIGNTFVNKADKELPTENKWLCGGIIGGQSWPINYNDGNDFYVAKGLIKRLLLNNNYFTERIELRPTNMIVYNQNRSMEILVDNKVVGSFGEVKKQILDSFDIKRNVAVFLIDLGFLFSLKSKITKYKTFSKYPKVIRDLSVILDESKEVKEIFELITAADKLIVNADIVDIYKGKPLDENKKSVTMRIEFQSDDKTLKNEEIDEIYNKIVFLVKKSGGEVKGGSSKT